MITNGLNTRQNENNQQRKKAEIMNSENAKSKASSKAPKQSSKNPPARAKRVKKERPARTQPAHMAKIEKILGSLPALTGDAKTVYVAANQLSTADLNNLLAHINVSIRQRGVLALAESNANGTKTGLAVGDTVRVVSGQPRFVGQVGKVTKMQRIRCYVQLEGQDKPTYLFISDVVASSSETQLDRELRRISTPPSPPAIHTIEEEESTTKNASNA